MIGGQKFLIGTYNGGIKEETAAKGRSLEQFPSQTLRTRLELREE